MTESVSIIIPCYNKRAYVAEAIESALAQHHPCEVIVVDDGSTDGSLDVIETFAGKIRWTTGPNRGGGAARNTGLDMAEGDWIQFLDADDILSPNKISAQLAALRDAPADCIAFSGWSYLHDDGRCDPPSPRPYWRDHEEGLSLLLEMWRLGGFLPLHVWLLPAALIANAGGWNTALTGDDDGEFFGRVLVRAGCVRFSGETSVSYRSPPPGSVSRDRSLTSAQSFLAAYEIVKRAIAERRWDEEAKRACLSRVRRLAYAWQQFDEIVERAAKHEKAIALRGFSPALPRRARLLIGLFGIGKGLALLNLTSPIPRNDPQKAS